MKNEIRDIGDRKQLFLDHTLAEKTEGVSLRMNTPAMTGDLVVSRDQPWEKLEGARIGHCSSVIREDGRFRLWYDSSYGQHGVWATGEKYRSMAYAESDDGINFSKPLFDMNPRQGYEKTNILIAESRGGDVWIDPQAPPERKYRHQCKFAFVVPGAKLEFFASPDGIRWSKTHTVDIGECDTANLAFWDDRWGRYVLYTRKWIRDDENVNLRYRQLRRFESDDLENWEDETVVWAADDTDLAKFTTHTGQPCMDYYGATVFKYPDAGDFYVIMAPAFWHWRQRPEGERWGHSGDPRDKSEKTERLGPSTMDVRLGFSRDGKNFHRAVDRTPFMRQGPEGRFDSKFVWPLPNPVPVGDELWIYYNGGNKDHDGVVDPAASGHLSGISRAVLRLDGFVSADADYSGGTLETPLLRFQGSSLLLNVDTSGGGFVKTEILDEKGRPVEGFSREDAYPLNGNSVRMPVLWGTGSGGMDTGKAAASGGGGAAADLGGDVSRLAGKPLRLRFHMPEV